MTAIWSEKAAINQPDLAFDFFEQAMISQGIRSLFEHAELHLGTFGDVQKRMLATDWGQLPSTEEIPCHQEQSVFLRRQ
jgi:hypothetical protein